MNIILMSRDKPDTLRHYLEGNFRTNGYVFSSSVQVTGRGHKFYMLESKVDTDSRDLPIIPCNRDGSEPYDKPVIVFLRQHLNDGLVEESSRD